jgi:hypothetical protein
MGKLPTGVTVIGILIIVFSSIGLLATLFALAMLPLLAEITQLTGMPTGVFVYSLIRGVITGTLMIVFTANVLMAKEWARRALVFLLGIVLIIGILELLMTSEYIAFGFWTGLAGWMVGAGLYLAVIWYLTRPHVMKAFE